MSKKIYLEEILDKFPELRNQSPRLIELSILAMKEACRQTLKLAAENATTEDVGTITDDGWAPYDIVNEQSILDTINQIE